MEHYGKSVTPNDPDKVIMRWKVSDSCTEGTGVYLSLINTEKLKAPNVADFFEKVGVGISDGTYFQ
jgi:hypothetical protein